MHRDARIRAHLRMRNNNDFEQMFTHEWEANPINWCKRSMCTWTNKRIPEPRILLLLLIKFYTWNRQRDELVRTDTRENKRIKKQKSKNLYTTTTLKRTKSIYIDIHFADIERYKSRTCSTDCKAITLDLF